jgi:purine-binding chemotaxis protein CheW
MNVVLRSRNEVVSLLVDDIGDVIDTAGAATEPVPPTLPSAVRDVVTGVIPLPEAILLVLDADLAADVPPAHRKPGGNP